MVEKYNQHITVHQWWASWKTKNVMKNCPIFILNEFHIL